MTVFFNRETLYWRGISYGPVFVCSQVGVLSKGLDASSWFFGIEASFDLSFTVL